MGKNKTNHTPLTFCFEKREMKRKENITLYYFNKKRALFLFKQ